MSAGFACRWVDRLLGMQAKRRHTPRSGVLLFVGGGLPDAVLFALMAERFRALAHEDEPIRAVVDIGSPAAQFLYPQDIELLAVDFARFARDAAYRWRMGTNLAASGYRISVAVDSRPDPALLAITGAEITFDAGPHTAGAPILRVWADTAARATGRDDAPPAIRFANAHLPPRAALRGPTVVLHPVSLQSKCMHSVETYEAILDVLPENHVAILAAETGALDAAPECRRLLDRANVRADESELWSKAALMRGVRLVVGEDATFTHLGAGLGVPVLDLAREADQSPFDPRAVPDNVAILGGASDEAICAAVAEGLKR